MLTHKRYTAEDLVFVFVIGVNVGILLAIFT